jgi:hypothetical protein
MLTTWVIAVVMAGGSGLIRAKQTDQTRGFGYRKVAGVHEYLFPLIVEGAKRDEIELVDGKAEPLGQEVAVDLFQTISEETTDVELRARAVLRRVKTSEGQRALVFKNRDDGALGLEVEGIYGSAPNDVKGRPIAFGYEYDYKLVRVVDLATVGAEEKEFAWKKRFLVKFTITFWGDVQGSTESYFSGTVAAGEFK